MPESYRLRLDHVRLKGKLEETTLGRLISTRLGSLDPEYHFNDVVDKKMLGKIVLYRYRRHGIETTVEMLIELSRWDFTMLL